jgi:acyl carrier protein
MSNHCKLKQLVCEVFLLAPEEYRDTLLRSEVETWDSLGIVSLAVGVDEVFGCHMTPEEATSLQGIQHLIALLRSKQIAFDD